MTVEWIFAPKERTPEQMAALLVSALPMPVTEFVSTVGRIALVKNHQSYL